MNATEQFNRVDTDKKKYIRAIKVEHLFDEYPDISWMEENPEDAKRLRQYHYGIFWFIGIRAKAEIVINGIIQHITSGGLWGIESDSDEKYFKQVGQEEIETLNDVLLLLGFSVEEIQAIEIEWED